MTGGSDAHVVRHPAHAKINLFLRVLGRGEDGYHALETLFARLALADDVEVAVGGGGRSLECTGEGVDLTALGPVEHNLAWRAAAMYAERCGWPRGFRIRLHKRIPPGGGLGGGSADAAAVLRALESLNPTPAGQGALLGMALALGADVPFMVSGAECALGWGRGERLLALPPLPARRLELLLPPFGVSTPAAFGWLAADRGPVQPQPSVLESAMLGSWDQLEALAGNDLQGPVLRRHPELEVGLAVLRQQGARLALMSGSGSTLFGVFDAARGGESGADDWPLPDGWRRVGTRLGR